MNIFVGIDIGGTTINIGLVSEEKQLLSEKVIETWPDKGPENAIHRISLSIEQMIGALDDKIDFKAIGVGLPGLLDIEKGMIIEASNLPGWQDFPISSALNLKTHLPVFIENDANLAALGEYWMGAGTKVSNLFMITLGSGIGGALIVDGKVFKLHPSAGEFGHMIIEKSGATCTCGRKGCLETFVSKHGFIRLAKEKMPCTPNTSLNEHEATSISPQLIARLAQQGDELANIIYQEAGEALGIAISNVINLTGISFIIIGGGIANAWKSLYKPVMQSLEKNVFKTLFKNVNVIKASLGEKSGFIGAAKLAADALIT
jgi:glucokinase